MIFPPECILVLGHQNPDTDASASAWGYAQYLTRIERYDAPVSAAVPGSLTPQSLFVFQRAGVEQPSLVRSLAPRVADVATREVDSLSVRNRFRDAVEKLICSDRSMLPVLDEDGKVHSAFSNRSDVSRYLLGFDVIPLLSNLLDWSDLVELPGGRSVGRPPRDHRIAGNLRVALEGDRRWRQELRPDDILVCGDISLALGLEPEKFPRWIVIASCGESVDVAGVERANQRGGSVMEYQHSLDDFLISLMSQVRLGALNLGTGPCVGEFDFLEDVRGVIQSQRHALPVLKEDRSLAGVISRSDLIDPPRRRVVLVDHFESSQTVAGMRYAEILEIIDHHRVGDLETANPVRVDCRPVGSSSTVVAMNFLERDIQPDRATATLLLGGLLADTLSLRGPTTRSVDRKIAARLSEISGLETEEFGLEILRAGDDLLTADPESIWNRDQKIFGIRNNGFAVAQLETTSLEEVPVERLDALRKYVQMDFRRNDYLLSILLLTNVLEGDSWLTVCEAPAVEGIIASCFGNHRPREGWFLARGIVSRKRQVLPVLMRALAEVPL